MAKKNKAKERRNSVSETKISDQKLKRFKIHQDEIEANDESSNGIIRPFIHLTSQNLKRRKKNFCMFQN